MGDFFNRKIASIERSSSASKNRDWAKGLSPEEAKNLNKTFGDSQVAMSSYSYLICFLKTLKSPMIILQVVGVIGFYLNHLWLLSAIQALFLVYAVLLTANRKYAKHQRMKSHSSQSENVNILRRENKEYKQVSISSKKLSVGDIVILENGLCLDSDLLVLRGTCTANETSFTGENYPVWKRGYLDIIEEAEPYSTNDAVLNKKNEKFDMFEKTEEKKEDNEGWEEQSELRARVDFREDASILESREIFFGDFDKEQIIYSASEIQLQEKQKSLGLVLKTGWNSRKGDLMIEMIYQKKSLRKLKVELIYLSIFLLSLGTMGIVLVYLFSKISNPSAPTDWQFIAEKAVEVIATVLPPALFLSFSISLNIGYLNLKKKGIKARNVDRLFEAARSGTILFDKTGTLTDNCSKVSLYVTKEDMQKGDITVNMEELSGCRGFREVVEIMGLCHGLRKDKNDQILGDMVDKALFEATNWKMKRMISSSNVELEKEVLKMEDDPSDLPFADFKNSSNLVKSLLEIPVKPGKFFSHKMLLSSNFAYTRERLFEFNHQTKRMSVLVSHPVNPLRQSDLNNSSKNEETQYKVLTKGAPETIYNICKQETLPKNFDQIVKVFSLKGLKPIALSAKLIEKGEIMNSRNALESDHEFLGLVFLENPLKTGSKKIIKDLNISLIKTKMVTGDNIHNAISTAMSVGLVRPGMNLFMGKFDKANQKVNFQKLQWTELQGKCFHTISNGKNIDDLRNQIFGNNNKNSNNKDSQNELKVESRISADELLLSTAEASISRSILDLLSLASVSPFVRFALDGDSYEHIISELAGKNNQEALMILHKKCVIYARASPETKRRIVKNHRVLVSTPNKLSVGFVGDGANDSKAIRAANFGIGLSDDLNSFGANFQADVSDIGSIYEVIIQGRSTLEKMLQNFRFVLLGNVYLTLCLIFLSFRKLDFTSLDNALADYLFITPIALLFLWTPSRKKLSLLLPSQSFLTLSIVLRILGHIIIFGIFLTTTVYIIESDIQYKTPSEISQITERAEMDSGFYLMNKLVFIILIFSIVGLGIGIARGYPFRESPMDANKFTLVFCLLALIIGIFTTNDWNFMDTTIVWKWIQQISRTPNIEFILLVKVVFVGVIASFFIFLFEKICDGYELWISTIEAESKLKKMKRIHQLEKKNIQSSEQPTNGNTQIKVEEQEIKITNEKADKEKNELDVEETAVQKSPKMKRKSKIKKSTIKASKLDSIIEEEEENMEELNENIMESLAPIKGPLDKPLFFRDDFSDNAADHLSFSASSLNLSQIDNKNRKKKEKEEGSIQTEDEEIKEFK
jgi:predicted P-type ATPase